MSEAYSLEDNVPIVEQNEMASGVFLVGRAPVRRQVVLALALAAPLSSSSLQPEEDWAALFPQASSLHSVPSEIQRKSLRVVAVVLPSTAEQLAAVQSFFGLAKTQLADICNVQRQTIYDWYAEKFDAGGDNARRLAELYKVVDAMKERGYKPLSSRIVMRALSSGSNLLDLLGRADLDHQELGAVIALLGEEGTKQRSRGAAAIQERLGWASPSSEVSDEILEANIEDFVDG